MSTIESPIKAIVYVDLESLGDGAGEVSGVGVGVPSACEVMEGKGDAGGEEAGVFSERTWFCGFAIKL